MSPTRRALLAQGLFVASLAPAAIDLGSAFSIGDRSAPVRLGTGFGVSVTAHGAKGDGETDDTEAVRAAIAALGSVHADQGAGGVVYFPNGLYTISSELDVPKNVVLAGDGPIASRLLYTGDPTDAFLTFGTTGQIATFSGVAGLWIDAKKGAGTAVRLFGPQEGSGLVECVVTGAQQVGVEVRSEGIEGGSNKFVVERCWIWTDGDAGRAGLLVGPGGGPLSVRDTTFVGTNRTKAAPVRSGGVVAAQSIVTLDGVNVEHFESHSYLDRTQADIRGATGFFNTYGVRTSPASDTTTLLVTNADFDRAEASILDEGSGVRLQVARSYWNEAYPHDRRSFRRNFWEVDSANVYRSARQQATMGFTSAANSDTSRFKFSLLQDGDWTEAAAIDADGVFGSAESSWNGSHLRLGPYHLWVDGSGRLRMKHGAPDGDTDGSVVGL